MTEAAAVRVNRAPVLTLWAAVVAERLGYPPATAMSLASSVAGTAARAKARRLGLAEPGGQSAGQGAAGPQGTARLLGRDIPLTCDADGVVLAEGDGTPAPAGPVQAYIARAFGAHLGAVRDAMQALAARYEPQELNRVGFRLYEAFRPEVPAEVQGWGAKGVLDLNRIRTAGSPTA